MTDITIPPEAVEAAARAYVDAMLSEPQRDPIAAALRAGIAAWPDFTTEFRRDSFMGWNGNLIILPLPTENTDAET